MKILVVDDSKTARYLAVKTLQDLGYKHVTEVASAEDALIRMKAEEFDLVFLDWNMEGMSGLDCLRQIRSNPVFLQADHCISAQGQNERDRIKAYSWYSEREQSCREQLNTL